MRRFIKSSVVAVVTFAIGVLVAAAWWSFYPRRVSLCTLARDPAAYHGKLITVEALGSVISSPLDSQNYLIIGEPGCGEPAAWASIELDQSLQLSRDVNDFINSTTTEIREATVVVEGRFDQWTTMGCFAPRFGIKTATVTLMSPVTTKPYPAMDSR